MTGKDVLLYGAEEHRTCSFHSPNGADSLVETLEITPEKNVERVCHSYEVVFVQSGKIALACDDHDPVTFSRRRLFLLAPGTEVCCTALKPAYLIVCRPNEALKYCDRLHPEKHRREPTEHDGGKIFDLPYRRPIQRYAENLAESVEGGLRCRTYLMAKHTELMYLLRGYYSKKELAAFFRPFLGKDVRFRSTVLPLIRQGKNVGEMADACHLSQTRFRSKFRREFGQSPRDYMMKKKREVIFDALSNGKDSFSRIALDNNMAGLNVLNRFCREQFGRNPSEIRSRADAFEGDSE